MQYNLERLGPKGFQDLAAALAIATFGPAVQAMGAGRDGGRDMHHHGPLSWTDVDDRSDAWSGYTVFQVKHKEVLAARPEENVRWLWGQIRNELDEWANAGSGRAVLPDQLVFISNVPLTPTPATGGHDQIRQQISTYIDRLEDGSRDVSSHATTVRLARLARLRSIKAWGIWDGNQVDKLVIANPGVRHAFPAFLSGADVLAQLAEMTDRLPLAQLEPGLRAHARAALIGDGTIYFDEAGSGSISGFPLHEMTVDLPVSLPDGTAGASAIGYLLDRSDRMLKPKLLLDTRPKHVVLTGAPGNGKTTLSKFLVQVFRSAMLQGAVDLGSGHAAVVTGTHDVLDRLGCAMPTHRRWPIRVDLAQYAQEGGLDSDSTLLKWIAAKVSARSNSGTITAAAMSSWMTQWPWFLVLDGLDEVSEPPIRKRLIEQITDFVNEAEADNADLFVVVTTRPIGYTEHIAPDHFDRVDLDQLTLEEAVRYGTLATRARLHTDADRIDKVVGRLRDAAADDGLQNLLRTPLQVLILTIIIEGAGKLAPDRYNLFWNYYETVFKREREKLGGAQHLLREHGQQILRLHAEVGFELQMRSETADRALAALTVDELRTIAWSVLNRDGFDPSGRHADLLEQILRAATHRLVLIVPRGDAGYGFDVRSLQEMAAAVHLTTGRLDEILDRMANSAANPHWRNTWLFAAGRLFATPQTYQHEAVIEMIESLDDDAEHRLGALFRIAPRLCLEIIDDGMTRSLPKWRSRLLGIGLRVLHDPAPDDLSAITRVIVRYADIGAEQASEAADGVRDALEGTSVARATTKQMQSLVLRIGGDLGAGLAAIAVGRAKARPRAVPAADSPDGWEDYDLEFDTARTDGLDAVIADDARVAIRSMRFGSVTDADRGAVLRALTNDRTRTVVASALANVLPHEPTLFSAIRDTILPTIYRRPVDADFGRRAAIPSQPS